MGYHENRMTHEYEGHYRKKHDPNIEPSPTLVKLIRERAKGDRLPCGSAFTVAEMARVTPSEVGRVADLLEIKITECQLGLFGHKADRRNIVRPAQTVSSQLEETLRGRLANGRLPCESAWDVARHFGMSKLEVTAACEKLGIRLVSCQLGTF